MPNITFYISEDQSDRITGFQDLTRTCFALCTEILNAEPDNIHIIFVNVRPGCGHPIYVELFYRLTESRTPEVMDKFMHELDAVIRLSTALTARIRCFGSPALQIYARN
ncbi:MULTISPECIES: hypothetical protein [unclassified Cedecea]|uniref:hypothetical protein n=2 Tax=Cedecea TaxID=158483 RepID=UPI00301B252F